MQKQMKLFEDFWMNLIKEKEFKLRKAESEGLKDREEDYEVFTWIKNESVRILTMCKDSDLKWGFKEEVVAKIPTNNPNKFYNFKPNATTEIFEFEVMTQRNPDIPQIEAYKDMGLEYTDPSNTPMDRVHFGECCAKNQTHLLALYEKNFLDWKKDFWKDEEWISEKLDISWEKAQGFSRAFELLDLGKKEIMKIFYGYVDENKIAKIERKKSWKMKEYKEGAHRQIGLLEMGPHDKMKHIDYLIDLGSVMQQLKKNDVSSGETLGDASGETQWERDADRMLMDEVPDETEYEDRFNLGKDSVFGTHKLYYGEEGVSHELLTYINNCDQEELLGMKKAMFPQKNEYGRTIKAEYWYLTGQQKSQVWRYINDRQEELHDETVIDFK